MNELVSEGDRGVATSDGGSATAGLRETMGQEGAGLYQ